MIFYSTGDNSYNSSAPAGDYKDSGWQWQGNWGSGNGTIVSPTQILTVKHYTATTFTYGGNTYSELSSVTSGDMKLVTLDTSAHGDFSSWAPLYAGTSEVGSEVVVLGRGKNRGSEVIVDTEAKGWKYGSSGTRHWGTNVIESVEGSSGNLLAASFTRVGGTEHEAHLATWDSGGGAFVKHDGLWQLVGVNYSVDAYFNTTPSDTGRYLAALYDMGGLYVGRDSSGWAFVTDKEDDISSHFYMHRVSSYSDWLQANLVLPVPEPTTLLLLVSGVFVLLRRRPSRWSAP